MAATAAADSSASVVETRKKPKPTWRNYTVAKGDTLSSIFHKQSFGASTLQEVMAASGTVAPLGNLRPGNELSFRVDDKGQLLAVRHTLGDLDILVAEAGPGGWQARVHHLKPTPHTVVKDGSVDGPLLSSLRAAGIPSGMAAAFVKIFHWKVDFRRDMRPGATFAVIYQQLMHDGKQVGQGPIEAAELTNAGKTLRVYRYENGKGGYNYYTAEGHSLEPSILRTPLHYTYVSSTFSR
ncbi:MAG TPA: LysM-like peptidoglycan-binding domain-containing protein, partial [Nitrococcus sp.]|nr:LysM-like peptidoglycan-binding domain-containing protein [Nitrococcus sp.]